MSAPEDLSSPELLYDALISLAADNQAHFESPDTKNHRLHDAFVKLAESVENLTPLLAEIRLAAVAFDFRNVQANGYRSFVNMTDTFTGIAVKVCRTVCLQRKSLFFQRNHYARMIEDAVKVYTAFHLCFEMLQILKNSTSPDDMFMHDVELNTSVIQIMDKLDTRCFFGRYLGFQFCSAIQPIIKTIAIMLAAYGEFYYSEKNIFFRTATCSQYLVNQEARANRITELTDFRTVSLDFCRTFWNCSENEIVRKLNSVFLSLGHSKIIDLQPTPLEYVKRSGKIEIPIPSAHIGHKSLNVRIVTDVIRQGMESDFNMASTMPASNWLIFHLHGGGFVSQTSESHQFYLKNWSMWTGAPIVSVDYTLAPAAPFPRALEEALYAYVWVLNNVQRFGSTGKRIVFAGDSAGACLCLCLTLKCIDMGIRIPDGVFVAYTPISLHFHACPSRMLGFVDPILSFGFMTTCIEAYACVRNSDASNSIFYQVRSSFPDNESDDADSNESMSPASTTSITEQFGHDENLTHPETQEELPTRYQSIAIGYIQSLGSRFRNRYLPENSAVKFEKKRLEDLTTEVPYNMYLSPGDAPDEFYKRFPPTAILTVEADPCLDDCVALAKKLDSLQRRVKLDVLKGLPHGFLNISMSCKEAFNGAVLCAQRIRALFTNTLQEKDQ